MNEKIESTTEQKEIYEKIDRLKKEKNAVVLAHNYQVMEVQRAADYVGDSLELSRIAAKTDAGIIVFCGVDFMAESAKILAPQKKVLLPEIKATCPMANMVTPEALEKARAENPNASVVAYVNTTARTKALVDICCTSANAVNVVNSVKGGEILFVPDKNLGNYINLQTGAGMKLWDGYCIVHEFFSVKDVERVRKEHPDALFIVHPESPPEVVAIADKVLSTSGMARFVAGLETEEEKRRGVIIGTEVGLIRQLQDKYPDTGIWPLNEFAVCKNMKMTTLPKVLRSLEEEIYEITLPEDVLEKARQALEKMIAVK